MPLYQMYCGECKKTTEVMCKVDERGLVRCKLCGGEVKQILSENVSFKICGYNEANGYSRV